MSFVNEFKTYLKDKKISFLIKDSSIIIKIPKSKDYIKISDYSNDNLIEIIGDSGPYFHTHAEVCEYYGGKNKTESTLIFIKMILNGTLKRLDEVENGKVIRTIVSEDIEDDKEYLPKGNQLIERE